MKLEIKENMYYRTRGGAIGKIVSLEDLNEREYRLNGFYINKNSIKNASYDIIDILEIDDYVNGSPICLIKTDEKDRTWVYTDSNYKCGYLKNDIESIVTKESYSNVEYKVEGK